MGSVVVQSPRRAVIPRTAGLPVPHYLLEFAQVHVHFFGEGLLNLSHSWTQVYMKYLVTMSLEFNK